MHYFKQQPITKNRSPQQQEKEPELQSLGDALTGNFAAATVHPEMLSQLQQQFGNSHVCQMLQRSKQLPHPQPATATHSPVQAKRNPESSALTEEISLPANTGGEELPQAIQQQIKATTGKDTSEIRVHGNQATEQLGADAYYQNNHIHFAQGKYNPQTQEGRKLIYHEVAHKWQQEENRVAKPPGQGIPLNTEPALEQEADVWASKIASGESVQTGKGNSITTSPASQGTDAPVQLQRSKVGRVLGSIISLGLGDLAARMTFGFQGERTDISTSTDQLDRHNIEPYNAADLEITAADIPGASDNFVLRGRTYSPKEEYQKTPAETKHIILLSGSGGSNEDQLEPVAAFYAEKGAVVYAVNYRGYGASRNKKSSNKESLPFLSEQGLYNDAYKIYQYVQQQGAADGDIIIHGYSLGGAVAAQLAKKLAKQGVNLGGLVLHSSIKSGYKAARGIIGIPGLAQLGGAITKASAGNFDTVAKLKSIAKHDPNLPIHYMSGSKVGDHLSLENTELEKTATDKLTNVSSHRGRGHHLNPRDHLDFNNQQILATLLNLGRGRDPRNPTEDEDLL